MNIIEAIKDDNLFKPFLAVEDSLRTWRKWITCLKVIYGIPPRPYEYDLIRQCTGRDPMRLPPSGFDEILVCGGRRSGKSRIASLCGAFAATLAGYEDRLASGETGLVAIISPTRQQSRIIKGYVRDIFTAPLLAPLLVRETQHLFELNNGLRIEILTSDHKAVRGYSLATVILDEAAFLGTDDNAKVKSDTEIVTAVTPGLLTLGGRLLAVTTPYAQIGWVYETFKRHWGNDESETLVWHAPSRLMNETLSQRFIDRKLAEDYGKARAEYYAEFRQDVGLLLSRDQVECCVVPERYELMPEDGQRYHGFVDVSGGRNDDAAMAVAHREGDTVVLDALRRFRPPHDPAVVIREMAAELKNKWGIRRASGDAYAAEFVARAFNACGIQYEGSEVSKSELYLDLLPLIGARQIELLDNDVLVTQLSGLERRVRSGGRDSVDHRRGSHDDLANVLAGAAWVCHKKLIRVGGLW